MGSVDTGLFDTHPADKERIACAKLEEEGEGIFHLDAPASDVFRNFDSLAKCASFDLYKSLLGPEITKDQLYTVSELVETQTVAQEGNAAGERYFLVHSPTRSASPCPGTIRSLSTTPREPRRRL